MSTDGAHLRAEARAHEQELQRDREHRDDGDQEQPVGAEVEPEHVHLSAQEVGQPHRLLRRPEEIGRRRDGHEHEADREHHLVEVRGLVEALVERPLERRCRPPPTTTNATGKRRRNGTPARVISITQT